MVTQCLHPNQELYICMEQYCTQTDPLVCRYCLHPHDTQILRKSSQIHRQLAPYRQFIDSLNLLVTQIKSKFGLQRAKINQLLTFQEENRIKAVCKLLKVQQFESYRSVIQNGQIFPSNARNMFLNPIRPQFLKQQKNNIQILLNQFRKEHSLKMVDIEKRLNLQTECAKSDDLKCFKEPPTLVSNYEQNETKIERFFSLKDVFENIFKKQLRQIDIVLKFNKQIKNDKRWNISFQKSLISYLQKLKDQNIVSAAHISISQQAPLQIQTIQRMDQIFYQFKSLKRLHLKFFTGSQQVLNFKFFKTKKMLQHNFVYQIDTIVTNSGIH